MTAIHLNQTGNCRLTTGNWPKAYPLPLYFLFAVFHRMPAENYEARFVSSSLFRPCEDRSGRDRLFAACNH